MGNAARPTPPDAPRAIGGERRRRPRGGGAHEVEEGHVSKVVAVLAAVVVLFAGLGVGTVAGPAAVETVSGGLVEVCVGRDRVLTLARGGECRRDSREVDLVAAPAIRVRSQACGTGTTCVARCQQGEVAIGGGYDAGLRAGTVFADHPVSQLLPPPAFAQGWYVGLEPAAGAANQTWRTFAVCMTHE
jgi:hypothetical protein